MSYPNVGRLVSVTVMPKKSPIVTRSSLNRLVLAAAIGLLAAACGASGIGGGSNPTPTPTPTPSSGVRFDVVVGDSDHQASMRVGQKLEIVLHAPNGMSNWTHPNPSDVSILEPIVDSAATAARGVTIAAYQALKPGQVQVTATASPICPPGSACPMYVAFYALKVTVTP